MNSGDPHKGINAIASLWLKYFEDNFDKQWWGAIQLLIKKAGLKNLDQDSMFSAGLLWVILYDFGGAVGSGSIKNTQISEWIISAIAKDFDADEKEIWNIFSKMTMSSSSHTIYQYIYKLFDEDEKQINITDDDAILGFSVISSKIMESSNLGYYFEHMSEINKSLK